MALTAQVKSELVATNVTKALKSSGLEIRLRTSERGSVLRFLAQSAAAYRMVVS